MAGCKGCSSSTWSATPSRNRTLSPAGASGRGSLGFGGGVPKLGTGTVDPPLTGNAFPLLAMTLAPARISTMTSRATGEGFFTSTK